MKKILGIVVALFLCGNVFSQGIEFQHVSFDEALAKAKAENKMVFMDCYTTWCGPCKALAKNVFPKQEVGDYYNANFVNLKMDMEKGEGPELLKRYGVKGFPTLLFIDAEGNVLYKRVGGTDPEGLIADGKLARDPNERLDIIEGKYKAGDRSKELVAKYIDLLQKNYLQDELNIVGKEYLKSITNEELLNPEIFKTFSLIGGDFESDKFQYVYKNKAKFVEVLDKESVEQFILYAYYKYVQKVSQNPDTKKLDEAIEAFKKEYAGTPYTSMVDRIYGAHYLTTGKFEKWFEFSEKEIKASEQKGKEKFAGAYLRYVNVIVRHPKFKEYPAAYNKAIIWIEKALQINPDATGTDYFLTNLYLNISDKENALKYLKKYEEDNPTLSGKNADQLKMLKQQISKL